MTRFGVVAGIVALMLTSTSFGEEFFFGKPDKTVVTVDSFDFSVPVSVMVSKSNNESDDFGIAPGDVMLESSDETEMSGVSVTTYGSLMGMGQPMNSGIT